MPEFATSRVVKYPPEAMFDLVADVEQYPDFLHLCRALRVHSRETGGNGETKLIATMTVGYGPVRESFTTKVTMDRAALRIDTALVDGPFHHLKNAWTFEPVPSTEGSIIKFRIDYAFRSRALQILLGSMFDEAFRAFGHAFEQRADVLYRRQVASSQQ